jgi:hypothetical protein
VVPHQAFAGSAFVYGFSGIRVVSLCFWFLVRRNRRIGERTHLLYLL